MNDTATLDSRPEDVLREIEERIAPVSTARLGVLLHDQRESHRIPLRDVALLPDLRSELEDIEAGRLRPEAVIVEALLRCYDVDLDQLVPPRRDPVLVAGTDQETLASYLFAVRHWRDSGKDPMLRDADFQVLARILGTEPNEIRRRLRHHAIEERIAPLSTARLALLVQRLRVSTRSRPDEVAPRQETLEEIKAGRLRPDTALLDAVLRSYDSDLDTLVPPRRPMAVVEGTHEEVLARYLAAMRRWRGRVKHPPLRDADVRMLAGILGTEPKEIEHHLRKLSGCSRRRARRLTAMLVTGMTVAGAGAAVVHHSNASAGPAINPGATHPEHSDAAVSTPAVSTPAVSTPAVSTPAVPTTAVSTTPAHTPAVHTTAADCATALIYLAAHAKPGFAHYCRPGKLTVGITDAVAYTCVPGPEFACPDGHAEIIIADPACAATYENEASNSYWNFNSGAVIQPGVTQDGRTWDPYGECS